MNCGIKEKERSTVEESYYYYWEVSSKKICLGENVKLPQFIPLFSSYTINNSRRFKFGAEAFAIPFESVHTPPLHWLGGAGLGCRFQDETLKHQ